MLAFGTAGFGDLAHRLADFHPAQTDWDYGWRCVGPGGVNSVPANPNTWLPPAIPLMSPGTIRQRESRMGGQSRLATPMAIVWGTDGSGIEYVDASR